LKVLCGESVGNWRGTKVYHSYALLTRRWRGYGESMSCMSPGTRPFACVCACVCMCVCVRACDCVCASVCVCLGASWSVRLRVRARPCVCLSRRLLVYRCACVPLCACVRVCLCSSIGKHFRMCACSKSLCVCAWHDRVCGPCGLVCPVAARRRQAVFFGARPFRRARARLRSGAHRPG
jgi:hypothetical protein